MRANPSETKNHCLLLPGRASAMRHSLDSIKHLTIQD
jgi:hypothetical protein